MTGVLAALLLLAHPGTAQGPNGLQKNNYLAFVDHYDDRSFSPAAFKEALMNAGFPEPYLDDIISHARRESGNFKSKLFREQNNAFGMRLARRRTTTAKGVRHGYAVYHAWYDSVWDYWLWYERKPIAKHQSWASYLKARKYTNPSDNKRENKKS